MMKPKLLVGGCESDLKNSTVFSALVWRALESHWSKCVDFEFVQPPEIDRNGGFEGLRRGVYMMTGDTYIVTAERLKQGFQFTRPLRTLRRVFQIPNNTTVLINDGSFGLSSITSVFSLDIWLSVVTLFIVFLVLSNDSVLKFFTKKSLFSTWNFFGHWTSQDTRSDRVGKSMALRCIVIVTAVLTIHSLTLFQGLILTQLMYKQPYKPPFSKYEDVVQLIRNGEARLNLVNPGFASAVSVMTDEKYESLQDALRYNPPLYLDIYRNASDRIEFHRLATDSDTPLIVVQSDVSSLRRATRKVCDFVFVITDTLLPDAFMLASDVDRRTIRCLNDAIGEHQDLMTVLAERWYHQKVREYEECRLEMHSRQVRNPGESIRLGRLKGTFLLWSVGTFVAICFAAVEHAHFVIMARLMR